MASRDGNGWVQCAQGHRHWGRFGAAGLLAYVAAGLASPGAVLLQHRAWWSHHGGTWGLPGGARDSHESAERAALREAAEESGVPADAVRQRGIFTDDHGGWSYSTVLAEADGPFTVTADGDETDEAAWIDVAAVPGLSLHPGFALHWPELSAELSTVTIIVDGANVVGSRPDGWWRDRAGAARRLRDRLGPVAANGVTSLPDGMSSSGDGRMRWLPDVVVVVEGAARPAAADAAAGPVRLVAAAGSGDDAIVAMAGQTPGRRVVVTADRELRQRCQSVGASVTGPSWLLGQGGSGSNGGATR